MNSRLASFAIISLILTAIAFPLIVFAPTVKAVTALYDSGDPTPEEQLVLEYINRARADPLAEGQRLGIDIHEGLQNPNLVGPRPPLAMNKILLSIAHAHSVDMYNLNYFAHNDLNGTNPFDRMTYAGYNFWQASENIAVGTDMSAVALEDLLMVDAGNPGRSHRANILDITPYPACSNPPCIDSEAGVGYYEGGRPNSYGGGFITEDFAVTPSSGPFLLGVVYDDRNSNSFYDIGEGIAGVTITPSSGLYHAISSTSGGYAFPIGTSGTITVTASGPGFGPTTKTVTLTGTNIKLDFVIGETSLTSIAQTFTSAARTSFSSSIKFLSVPSSFVSATTPGTISACGSTLTSNQSSSSCGSSFTATANLPIPSSSWQFDHWAWAGGVSCSSGLANPTSCLASTFGGLLMAVYGARVTFLTNPASQALIAWGSCSNLGQGNGASIFSTSYGSVTACYVPSGYRVYNWSCSGGLACSGSDNSTVVTFTGPGTIMLNLETGTNSASTILTVTTSSSTSTYFTPEFGVSETVMASSILVAVFLILIRRKASRKN